MFNVYVMKLFVFNDYVHVNAKLFPRVFLPIEKQPRSFFV